MSKKTKHQSLTYKGKTVKLGGFYRNQQGAVVEICGYTETMVIYRPEGGELHQASLPTFATWEYLPDLRDFPNASDPRLPHFFDMEFGLKTMGELRRAIYHETLSPRDEAALRRLMAQHGIRVDPVDGSIDMLRKP
jgi:hypothetical protein